MRGCLTLVVGFLIGAALMLYLWPRVPTGTSAPQRTDVRVTISYRYLSRLLASRLSGAGLLTGIAVTSSPSHLLILHADAAGVPVALSAQPVVVRGTVQVHLLSSSIGGVPVPPEIIAPLTGSIQSSLRHLLGTTSTVRAVSVQPNGVQIFANEHP